ncbi:MAG: hypothetical protein ACKVOQ_07210 [Cyclobacteriaceae bacterium]
MKKQILFFVGLAMLGAFILLLEGCGDEPQDLCRDKEAVSADFIMGEQFLSIDTVINEDTVLSANTIVFEAKGDYPFYEWKIGEDIRVFNTKRVSLFFESVIQPKTIDVQLKVRDESLSNCFPNSGIENSMTKKLTILEKNSSIALGSFEGYLESDPATKIIVSIEFCNPNFKETICTTNIDNGCTSKATAGSTDSRIHFEFSYRAMRIGDVDRPVFLNPQSGFPNNNCNDPKGWLYFDKTINDVIIKYTVGEYLKSSRKSLVFKGKRIS